MEKVELMTRSLIKLTCRDSTPVRTKPVYELKRLGHVCAEGLKERTVKGEGRLCYGADVSDWESMNGSKSNSNLT